jgi:hypothetical protein
VRNLETCATTWVAAEMSRLASSGCKLTVCGYLGRYGSPKSVARACLASEVRQRRVAGFFIHSKSNLSPTACNTVRTFGAAVAQPCRFCLVLEIERVPVTPASGEYIFGMDKAAPAWIRKRSKGGVTL